MLALCVAERGRRNTSGVEYNVPFREESCRNSCIYSSPFTVAIVIPSSQHPSTHTGAESIQLHPKTLIKMWITCLDRVSANSEKGRGSEWAVRVGQRLQSRFGKSGAARKSGLVQIVVEVSAIRGDLTSTWPFEPVFGWRVRSVLRDYRHGLLFGTACYKLYIVEVMVCSLHS